MSRIRSRALFVAGLSSLTSLAIADTTFATTTPAATASSDDLDALLAEALGDQDGGIAVLSIRDGETTIGVVGDANAVGEPVVADTPFRIGRPTMMFVSAIVMQLVDEGLVELDAPLSTYLPDTPIGGDIPIAYLLGHRSGLPEPHDDGAFQIEIQADLKRAFAPEEILAYIEDVPAVADPGAELAFSTANYILLGQLIEAVDGADLNTVLQRRIAEPIGLHATSFETADTPAVEGLAAGWDPTRIVTGDADAPYTLINEVVVAPDGTIWAVGDDDGEGGGLYRITHERLTTN